MFDLSGKIALITGSVAGLGKAMAMALARQGTTVILNGRSDEYLETTQQEFSGLGLSVHKACFQVQATKFKRTKFKRTHTFKLTQATA